MPTPEDVGFAPLAAVPSGEQILYNDWSFPDAVKSMKPDGSDPTAIFEIYRVWSMGVSRARDRIAIACGDPDQEAHYGVSLGDAIQHTWIYDMAEQSIEVLDYGNINDECHHFGAGDDALYVCRRYDFDSMGTFSGYRLGRIDLPSGDLEWLLPESSDLTLNPNVTGDGGTMFFTRVVVQGGEQTRTLEKLALPSGSPEVVLSDAYRPVLSPDGTRMVWADSTQQSALVVSDPDGSDSVLVTSVRGTSPTWSPDGTQIAYLVWDDAAVCAHVEVVAADGSDATSPTRIVDCSETNEQITELSWIVRP